MSTSGRGDTHFTAHEVDALVDQLWARSASLGELDMDEGAWSKYPYSVSEAALPLFNTAILSLLEAIKERNWLALLTPIHELQELVDMKLRPGREYLITLIELLYRLACGFKVSEQIIGPDPKTRARLAEFLTKILKKTKKLLYGQLSLNYRPLWGAIERILFPSSRISVAPIEEQSVDALIDLALMARRWFDGIELLRPVLLTDEGLADMSMDHDRLAHNLCMLVLFLPSRGPHLASLTRLLEPKSVLWSTNSRRFETLLMILLARTVKNLRGNTDGELVLLHADSLKFLFGVFTKHLRLNQPEKTVRRRDRLLYHHQTSLKIVSDRLPEAPRIFGKAVAYGIANGVGEFLSQLDILLAGIESYFHPSNSGPWTEALSTFTSACVQLIAKGIGLGRSPLQDAWRTRLVQMMWPAAERLSMSKNPYISIGAATMIKWLFFIDPHRSISEIIRSNAALTLTSLCEPHRTLSCLMVLGRTARLELEGDSDRVEGDQVTSQEMTFPKTEVNYLELLPPSTIGIDYNDPFKTIATLNLFTNIFLTLPLDERVAPAEYSEELISMILDRSFTYIESLSQARKQKDGGGLEHLILMAFEQTWMAMFAQMSTTLWRFAIDRLRLFLGEVHGGAGGGEMIARLTLACKGRNVRGALDKLLPLLFDQLERLLDASSSMGKERHGEESSCAALIWSLSAICGLLRYSGEDSVGWKGHVIDLLPRLIQLKQERCVDLVCKMVKSCLRSWCDHYPLGGGAPHWASEDHYGGERAGLAALPLRLGEVRCEWFNPTEASKTSARELCQGLYQALPLSASDLGTNLKYRLLLARSLVISTALASRVDRELEEILTIALDESQTLENRSLATAILDASVYYVGYSNDALQGARLRTRTLVTQLQRYPREKCLPPLVQVIRQHQWHKRLQVLLRSAATRRLRSDLVEKVLILGLSSHSSIRRPAQMLLVKIFMAYPLEGQRFVVEMLMPKALKMAQEGSLKGAVHIIKQFQRSLSVSFLLAQQVLADCFLMLNEHGGVPKLADFTIQAVRDLSLNICPRDASLADPTCLERMLCWVISVYQDSRSSWKAQAVAIFLMSILAESATDAVSCRRISEFIMECLCSENAEVRSLAISHGARMLHRWHLLFPDPVSDPSFVQWTGSILERCVKYLAQEYHPAPSSSRVAREGHHVPHFRYDCAYYVQSLAEVIGTPLVELLETAFTGLTLDASLAHIRATAEVYSGCVRGLISERVRSGDDEPLLSLLTAMGRRMDESGVESADVWYEAGHMAVLDGVSAGDSAFLIEWFLGQYSLRAPQTTVNETIRLRFLAGLLRDATGYDDARITSLCADALNSPFDMLRVSVVKLCTGRSSGSSLTALRDLFNCPRIIDKSPLARSCLIAAEYLVMDPGHEGFWSEQVILKLLHHIASLTISADASLQNEARRVLRLLAWAGLLPVHMALIVLERVLLLGRSPDLPAGSRKYLLEFLRLFYGRNLSACHQLGPSLVEERLTMDDNLEVRLEAAELYKLIFHSNPSLAEQWSGHTSGALSALRSPSVVQLHGWTLVASALVLSSPYSIPSWMPQILTLLTRFLGERHPIQGTIRRTFSEFKRTHGDTWEQDRSKFTEDQLDSISELLVAPSYYA